MRIQHNIMAMNAYRNYTNNVSAMKGNLEKLSSGYKINRAGDDAAGLAISEKMRAQITGLQQAQNNAKSGINLVQTAEGALQEVQDMLNRMVKLAEQSANGTYDDGVDRFQLQKEFQKLTDEIDRIADSANFNGIKLLDGSLAGTGSSSPTTKTEAVAITADKSNTGTITSSDPTAGAEGTVDLSGTLTDGDEVTINGTKYTYNKDATNGDATEFKDLDDLKAKAGAVGKDVTITINTEKDAITATTTEDFDFGNPGNADVTIGGKTFEYSGTAGVAGKWNDASELKALLDADDDITYDDGETTDNVTVKQAITGTWGGKAIAAKAGDGAETVNDLSGLQDGDKITINGNVYEVDSGADGSDGAKFADLDALKAAIAKTDAASNLTVTGTDLSDVKITKTTTTPGTATGGLKLQIGDTAHTYNKIVVSISSIKSTALVDLTTQQELKDGKTVTAVDKDGVPLTAAKTLSEISVEDQDKAAVALGALKGMVNYISDIRGELGATQNRLTHTINNLSVMTENIQDAESTIRDTDVADEMMAYTKNNILIQSAQAMLAQANQVPQGVLQLLQ